MQFAKLKQYSNNMTNRLMKSYNMLSMAAVAALCITSCVKDELNPDALIPAEKPEAPVTLVINEVDPNNKKLEFYNDGQEEISLKGCYLLKDGSDRWDFPDVKVAAKGHVVYTAKSADANDGPSFGMSATKGFKIELFDKNDKSLDVLDNSKDSDKFFTFDEGIDPVQTLGRKTDGDPQWVVFCPGSIGDANDKGTFVRNWGEAPAVEATVVLNEMCGLGADNEKFIELYNPGSKEVSLAGYTISKDESTCWTGADDAKIPAKGFFAIIGAKGSTPDGFSSGFSAKKSVIVELFDADGKKLDTFQRGEKGTGWGDQSLDEAAGSWSRIPDGTGKFKVTEATPGKANKTEGTEDATIIQ